MYFSSGNIFPFLIWLFSDSKDYFSSWFLLPVAPHPLPPFSCHPPVSSPSLVPFSCTCLCPFPTWCPPSPSSQRAATARQRGGPSGGTGLPCPSHDFRNGHGKTRCWPWGLPHLSGVPTVTRAIQAQGWWGRQLKWKYSRGMCLKEPGGFPCSSNHKGLGFSQGFLHFM